jgi:hypothetical protein
MAQVLIAPTLAQDFGFGKYNITSKVAYELKSGMITALVLAEGAPAELAATLSALVPAVVDGLIGDAVIILRQTDATIEKIAEIAGANVVFTSPGGDPWRAGAARARREWLLCLRSGDIPGEGWMRAADRFLAGSGRGGQPLARFSRRKPFRATAVIDLGEQMVGTRNARAGDLALRDWLTAREPARVRPGRLGAAIERDIAVR